MSATLSLAAGPGTINISSSQNLASITINSGGQVRVGASGDYLIRTAGLSIASGGTMDLGQSDLIVSYAGGSPVDAIRQDIFAGRLITSVNAPTPDHYATLAQVDNNLLHQVVWNGTPINNGMDFNQVIVKHTYMGDTNLDGQVTSADYANVIANQGRAGAQWFNGDLNHDGVVNADDLAEVSLNLGAGTPGGSGPQLLAATSPSSAAAAKPSTPSRKKAILKKPHKPAKPNASVKAVRRGR